MCLEQLKLPTSDATYGSKKEKQQSSESWIKCVSLLDVMPTSLIATLAISCPIVFGAILVRFVCVN